MADTTVVSSFSTKGQKEEQCSFPVYLIYSKWSLVQLDNFLKDYGDVGFLRIVYDNDGKETDRTIAILPGNVYNALCEDGYGDSKQGTRSYGRGFRVTPFILKESNYPGEGRTQGLFVPVPKTFGEDDSQVIAAVVDKLKHLAEWGIVDDNSWSVNVPLKSRETGGVRGGCFVSFKRDVSLDRIAMVRVLLTDTYWPEHSNNEDRSVFRCFWARDRNGRPENNDKGDKGDKSKGEKQNVDDVKKVRAEKQNADEVKKIKDEKRREAIHRAVKKAKPVQKKAPVVPIAAQPVLNENILF